MIIDYHIARGQSASALEKAVKAKLPEWQPQGAIVIIVAKRIVWFYQTMVKCSGSDVSRGFALLQAMKVGK